MGFLNKKKKTPGRKQHGTQNTNCTQAGYYLNSTMNYIYKDLKEVLSRKSGTLPIEPAIEDLKENIEELSRIAIEYSQCFTPQTTTMIKRAHSELIRQANNREFTNLENTLAELERALIYNI